MAFKGHGKFNTTNITILAFSTAVLFLVALSCTNGVLASASPIAFGKFFLNDIVDGVEDQGRIPRMATFHQGGENAKRNEKMANVLKTLQGITEYYDKVARPR